jgi:hypothetical protein
VKYEPREIIHIIHQLFIVGKHYGGGEKGEVRKEEGEVRSDGDALLAGGQALFCAYESCPSPFAIFA